MANVKVFCRQTDGQTYRQANRQTCNQTRQNLYAPDLSIQGGGAYKSKGYFSFRSRLTMIKTVLVIVVVIPTAQRIPLRRREYETALTGGQTD